MPGLFTHCFISCFFNNKQVSEKININPDNPEFKNLYMANVTTGITMKRYRRFHFSLIPFPFPSSINPPVTIIENRKIRK